jgi:succinate dehydrogenase / fumarate reductase, flavoprotein subunit
MIQHDILVVGGGLAGLRTALGLCEHWNVAVVSKVHPVRSHSGAAQGGINAALGNAPDGRDDSPERHAFDTIKGSDYLADQTAVARMCELAPAVIYELEHWGTPFSRFPDGSIAQRPFGGGGFPRTCYAADQTGHVLLHTLYEQVVKHRIKVYNEYAVTRLVVEDGLCHGVIAYDMNRGRFESFAAKFCVFATGGYGRMYRNSTNALINTGSGVGMALMAGIPAKDMEFVQFHPTTLYGTNILITEGARGEGGYLLNRNGERFMATYAPKTMELAPRDIVARSIQTEINQGRGFEGGYLHLDLRHLGRDMILQRLPGIRTICIEFAGIDPIDEPIPIQPGQHYSMGGIDTDVDGKTKVDNFYAAGECACVSVHGANRLGGNSLADTVIFGRLVAEAINARKGQVAFEPKESVLESRLRQQTRDLDRLFSRSGGVSYSQIRDEMRQLCVDKIGLFRQEKDLAEAVSRLGELREQYRHVCCRTPLGSFNYELLHVVELESLLALSEIIARGALARQESRGSHFRLDYPVRNDSQWLKHTVATLDGGQIAISYKEVDVSRYEPKERIY